MQIQLKKIARVNDLRLVLFLDVNIIYFSYLKLLYFLILSQLPLCQFALALKSCNFGKLQLGESCATRECRVAPVCDESTTHSIFLACLSQSVVDQVICRLMQV